MKIPVNKNPERIGHLVFEALGLIKNRYPLINVSVPIEFYDIDEDYDVKITVRVVPKKSQYELGMEMFHGNKNMEEK